MNRRCLLLLFIAIELPYYFIVQYKISNCLAFNERVPCVLVLRRNKNKKREGKRSLELVSNSDIFAHHDSSLLPRPVSKIHECHSRIVLQWFSAVSNTLDCACRRMSSQSDRVSVRISMMRTRKYVNLRVYTRYVAREKKVHFRAYGEYSQEYSRSTHNNNCAISSSPDTQVFATRRFLRQVDTGMFKNHLDAIPRRKSSTETIRVNQSEGVNKMSKGKFNLSGTQSSLFLTATPAACHLEASTRQLPTVYSKLLAISTSRDLVSLKIRSTTKVAILELGSVIITKQNMPMHKMPIIANSITKYD